MRAAGRRSNGPAASTLRRLTALLALLAWSACGTASEGDDERDDLSRKLLACAGCHETPESEGMSYAPSIAGKPTQYLYRQLLNYREGRRSNDTMAGMLAYLGDDYLHAIAAHYARLPAHDFRPEPGMAERPSAEMRLGRTLALEGSDGPACVACHGDDLRGDGEAIPSLRGLSAVYIAAQLGAWRAGTRHARPPDCMKDVASRLSGTETVAVARWIAYAFEPARTPLDAEAPPPCGALR